MKTIREPKQQPVYDNCNKGWKPHLHYEPDGPSEERPSSKSDPLRQTNRLEPVNRNISRKQIRENLDKRLEKTAGPPTVEATLDSLMKQHIEFDLSKDDLQDNYEIREHEKSRSITKFYYDVKKFVAYIEKEYHDNIWQSEKELPGWMMKDQVIARLMKNTRLADVLKALRKHSEAIPDRRRDKRLVVRDGVERRKNKGYLPVCFITDKDFYDKILPELGMAQITLQHYLIGLTKVGAIKKIDKNGFNHIPRRSIIYCIGYRYDYPGGQKNNWLLTEKMRKQLRQFKLP